MISIQDQMIRYTGRSYNVNLNLPIPWNLLSHFEYIPCIASWSAHVSLRWRGFLDPKGASNPDDTMAWKNFLHWPSFESPHNGPVTWNFDFVSPKKLLDQQFSGRFWYIMALMWHLSNNEWRKVNSYRFNAGDAIFAIIMFIKGMFEVIKDRFLYHNEQPIFCKLFASVHPIPDPRHIVFTFTKKV